MTKQVLFIQGAGEGAHEEDAKLAESLQNALGNEYEVTYPALPNEGDASQNEWSQQIAQELSKLQGPITLVGHSVGASTLLKFLSDNKPKNQIIGIFVMATPFWGGAGWHYEGYEELELPDDLVARLPQDTSIFLYHCKDDGTVPYEHLALYMKLLPAATGRSLDEGGHQLNNDMSLVAEDVKALQN